MNDPQSLTVLIPTYDPARPLERCLRSIVAQPLMPLDEVVVIGDTRDGALPDAERVVASFGPQFRYVGYDGGRPSFGHDQINYGMTLARACWLVAQDDDDVFTLHAFDAIRRAAAALTEPRPLMFKFVPWFRQLLPPTRAIVFQQISGHCFVPPNIPGRLGTWTARYEGDYDWIRSTVDLWPNKDADVVWCEDIISLARPDQ